MMYMQHPRVWFHATYVEQLELNIGSIYIVCINTLAIKYNIALVHCLKQYIQTICFASNLAYVCYYNYIDMHIH